VPPQHPGLHLQRVGTPPQLGWGCGLGQQFVHRLLPGDPGVRCRASTCPALTAPAVARPAQDHYLPDLHHLRLELEEAATPEGHAVRFGFNPLEFENFSWRGYAQMTPIQVRALCSWHDGWQRAGGPLSSWVSAEHDQEGAPTFRAPNPTAAQDRGTAEPDLPRPLPARLPLRQPRAHECERAGFHARPGQVHHVSQL